MSTENTGDKTFLPHYTDEDIKAIIAITSWLTVNPKYTQASLARLIRASSTTVNLVLAGKYTQPPKKWLDQLLGALKITEVTADNSIPAVETGVFKLAKIACNQARDYGNFSVLTANVGIGKTFALRHCANENPNTYLIEATPTMNRAALIKRLARKIIGSNISGSLDDKIQAIEDAISGTTTLIIVDEAELLNPACLEILRRLRDIARIGIVLSGTERLRGMIKPEHGQFDQIRSRVGFFSETISAISPEDAAALVQASFNEDLSDEFVDLMHRYANGSARMLVEGLVAGVKRFRDQSPNSELTTALVHSVAKKVLHLKEIKVVKNA